VDAPLFLFAIVVTVWYAGVGPAVLAVVLSSLGFDFFFTEPRYSFYLTFSELPHYAAFVVFAFLLASFAAVRRRAEAELLQARDQLEIERKRVQEALRQNETYLAEAQRLSHTGSFGWKPSTGAITWSDETFRIFHYGRTTTPTIELILQRVHPEDAALVQQTVERATREEKGFEHEYRLIMPDGSLKHLYVVSRPLKGESGTVEFVGAVMDVTERKRAAEALLRTEAYLAEGQKLSHTGTWACNIATREMIHSSEEHRHLFGLTPDKIGIPPFEEFYQRIHPDERAPIVADLERAMAAGTDVEAHFRVILTDGTTRYMYGVGHPIVEPSGESVEFVGTVMDVTAAKLAEQTLRENEAYLAEAQRLSHTGSWARIYATGESRYYSEECYRMLGFDPLGGPPRFEAFLQRVHPEDRARVREITAAAGREKIEYEVGYRIVHPDGEIRDIHTIGHPVFNPSGEIVEYVGTVIDVTERKRAEQTLRESEAYLSEAQRLSHTGSWAWVPGTGEIRYCSEECYRLMGFDPHGGQPRFETFFKRIHPDDQPMVVKTLERATRERVEFEMDDRIVYPGGEIRDVHVVGHPVLSPSGDLVEFVGTLMDITERKRGEEKLRQSAAYLAEGQRLSHTGSWAWQTSGRKFVHASEEWYRIYGFDPAASVPTWEQRQQIIHPEDRAEYEAAIDRAIAEKSDYDAEFRIFLPNGTARYIRTIGHPVLSTSGDVEKFVGTTMDVTESRLAEALRHGENRILEMIARDAPLEEILEQLVLVVEAQFAGLLCSILLLDEEGQHARHGAAPSLPQSYVKAIDGLSIGPNAGSCGTAMYRREPVVVSDILQDPLWEAYREVAEPYGFRACWSTPILAHSGKALGSFAMYSREPRSPYPSETRALEMATHLAGIAIERKLAREERERLREAQAELAHINRVTTMGELTASLAHEVNQPIAAAATDANTCLRWLAREQPELEEARAAASRVVKDAARAAEIMSRIRSLFKKEIAQRELVDVNEILRGMIELLRSEATRYSISMRTELSEDLPRIVGDRVQLQQVTMNLIVNSIDAMKEVEGTREITISSQRAENEQLQVSVSDTGIGLPSQRTDQIFNAFFTTKPHGTGMGLRISRSIVESHGGRLWAAHNVPHGARFAFTLPTTIEGHE
jgi:PAS domain S-box-containing protein